MTLHLPHTSKHHPYPNPCQQHQEFSKVSLIQVQSCRIWMCTGMTATILSLSIVKALKPITRENLFCFRMNELIVMKPPLECKSSKKRDKNLDGFGSFKTKLVTKDSFSQRKWNIIVLRFKNCLLGLGELIRWWLTSLLKIVYTCSQILV